MKHTTIIQGLALLLVFGLAGCDTLGDINPFDKEKEAKGIIEAIGANSFTVDGFEYAVTGKTKFEDVDGLSDLSVGDEVEVDYEEHGGSRTALEVDLIKAGDGGGFTITYDPPFDPSALQTSVTNPYFPLTPGTVWTYEGETEDGMERIVVEVLNETREVAGITATVVHDRVYLDGSLIEDTFDWYVQDPEGNVWYLGEDSKVIEDGQVVSTAGSWETGVDGAVAGVQMPAEPAVGQAYQQEFYEGEAEDRGRVLSVNEAVTVPTGSYTDCVKTEDTTPLEPDVLEYKYYCPGVGNVLEVAPDSNERIELVSVDMP